METRFPILLGITLACLSVLLVEDRHSVVAQPKKSIAAATSISDRVAVGKITYADNALPPDAVKKLDLIFAGKLVDAYSDYKNARDQAKDEFERRDVESLWKPKIEERAAEDKSGALSTLWLMRVMAEVGPYDFDRHFFLLEPYGTVTIMSDGLTRVGGLAIVEDTPFEAKYPGSITLTQGGSDAATYRLSVNENDARELRKILGEGNNYIYIELALRILRHGRMKVHFDDYRDLLQARAVAERLAMDKGSVTEWRFGGKGPQVLIGSQQSARKPQGNEKAQIRNINLFVSTLQNRARAKNLEAVISMCRVPLGEVVSGNVETTSRPILEEDLRQQWLELVEPILHAELTTMGRNISTNEYLVEVPNRLSGMRKNPAGKSRFKFERGKDGFWLLTEVDRGEKE